MFAIWLESPQKTFLRFNARKPHPPITLHVKYRCVGVYPNFDYLVNCSAFVNANFASHVNTYYCNRYSEHTVMLSTCVSSTNDCKQVEMYSIH